MKPLTRRAQPLLGTLVEIGLRGGEAAIFEAAFAQIRQVQARMSAHSAESDLAAIARLAHHRAIAVDATTAEVIRHSLEWAEASQGAFDPVQAGVALVHGGRRPWFCDELPDRLATWRDLSITGLLVRSTRRLALDLGGVAKGYAVDLAAETIAKHGGSGVVNAGGDLRFIGEEPRTAFVRSPDSRSGLFEIPQIPRPALATTGSYEFSEGGGNLDLIDSRSHQAPATGISISVFSESCMQADAMTKVLLNLPEAKASAILRQYGCSALILKSGGRCLELPR